MQIVVREYYSVLTPLSLRVWKFDMRANQFGHFMSYFKIICLVNLFRQLGNKCFQEFKSLIGANSFPPQKHVNWVVTPTAETNRLLLWVDSIFFWINMCQRGIFYGSAWQSEHFYLTPKWTKVSEEITVIPFNFVTKPNPMDSFCFFLNELNTCSWQLSLQKKRRKKEEKKKKTAK